jgi:hypothetical protein
MICSGNVTLATDKRGRAISAHIRSADAPSADAEQIRPQRNSLGPGRERLGNGRLCFSFPVRGNARRTVAEPTERRPIVPPLRHVTA